MRNSSEMLTRVLIFLLFHVIPAPHGFTILSGFCYKQAHTLLHFMALASGFFVGIVTLYQCAVIVAIGCSHHAGQELGTQSC